MISNFNYTTVLGQNADNNILWSRRQGSRKRNKFTCSLLSFPVTHGINGSIIKVAAT